MSKVKLLTGAVIVLVLLNIGTVAALYMGKPGHGGPLKGEGPKAIIIERLHFDAGQVAAYEDLIRDHRQHIDSLDKRMMELRGAFYGSQDGTASDPLIQLIGATQSAIERVHAAHFADIRALCRPEQLPLYEDLSKELAHFFRPGPLPPKRHR